jgi:SecD/SecF fusion protein
MARRYVWLGISGVAILACVVSLAVQGLNLGIDFKGGTQINFKTHTAYSTDDVRAIAGQPDVNRPDAVVQGRGTATADGKYREWQVRTKTLASKQQDAFQEDLQQKLGAYASGTKNVSASFGHQIAYDALWGILVSIFLILIYISLRFDRKFSVPVILAMLHDIVITVGAYSLLQREVSVATVAAVLTVLGYSIYDTIIIFDRVRENIPLMRRQPFATIMNVSLWETIRRSLATTFITLLPIIALEVLGGATLKDFAIALIVGVTSGAYSSIFIAAPLLTIWKEREPEYANRRRLAQPAEETALRQSEQALAAEPTPELVDVVQASPSEPGAQARREQRRQRRRTRPHGRAR